MFLPFASFEKTVEFSSENIKVVPGYIDIAYVFLVERSLLKNFKIDNDTLSVYSFGIGSIYPILPGYN